MKFNSAKEMLEVIQNGFDLYNPTLEIYVFVYNEAGSIAYYDIDNKKAKELSQKAKEFQEYWAAFLGPGGFIIDDLNSDFYKNGNETNLQWCEKYYKKDDWINTEEYV